MSHWRRWPSCCGGLDPPERGADLSTATASRVSGPRPNSHGLRVCCSMPRSRDSRLVAEGVRERLCSWATASDKVLITQTAKRGQGSTHTPRPSTAPFAGGLRKAANHRAEPPQPRAWCRGSTHAPSPCQGMITGGASRLTALSRDAAGQRAVAQRASNRETPDDWRKLSCAE